NDHKMGKTVEGRLEIVSADHELLGPGIDFFLEFAVPSEEKITCQHDIQHEKGNDEHHFFIRGFTADRRGNAKPLLLNLVHNAFAFQGIDAFINDRLKYFFILRHTENRMELIQGLFNYFVCVCKIKFFKVVAEHRLVAHNDFDIAFYKFRYKVAVFRDVNIFDAADIAVKEFVDIVT
ncbi:hypothetical protein ADUPG1_003618, partial [Aduncisulcus paluster]